MSGGTVSAESAIRMGSYPYSGEGLGYCLSFSNQTGLTPTCVGCKQCGQLVPIVASRDSQVIITYCLGRKLPDIVYSPVRKRRDTGTRDME